MSDKLKGVCFGAGLLLAACAAPSADQAASTAASAANQAASALPSDVASAAASVANQAASALPSDAASAINQAASAASSALAGIVPPDLRLQQDQPLVLDVTQQVAGVSNYRWTIAQAPPGGESVQGTTIEENSNGKLTINPSDYAQYFPVSGNYVVNLELTNENGTVDTVPIPVIVP